MDYTSGPWVTAVGLAGLLYSEYVGFRGGVWLCKPLASLGFLLTASPALSSPSPSPSSSSKRSANPFATPAAPPPSTIFNRSIFASLVLCLLGDVLLIPSSPAFFTAGLFAFLLGHVGFGMAFAQRDIDPRTTLSAAAAQALIGGLVWRWLSPNLPVADRVPVGLYVAVISAMGATAVGGAGGWTGAEKAKAWVQVAGAILFQVSDLFVARQQFVFRDVVNPMIGLPLYYAATTLLATLVWP